MEEDERSSYVNNRVNPLLEELVAAVLVEEPDDLEGFMIEWLQVRRGDRAPQPKAEKLTFSQERAASRPAPQIVKKTGPEKAKDQLPLATVEQDDMSEEDDDDYLDEDSEIKDQKRTERGAVMSEVYGEWNKKGDFTP